MAADDQLIVDGVRASMSIPFFFEPVQHDILRPFSSDSCPQPPQTVTWVDGGLLSNIPMEVFNDRQNGVVGDEWPTVGVKLADQKAPLAPREPTKGPLDETIRILKTVLNNANRYYATAEKARSPIFVDSAGIVATDF
jgi:NTE family protein